MHTFLENVKLALAGGLDLSATVSSAAVESAGARGNAIALPMQLLVVDDTNFVTLTVEESEDNSNWTPVVNGGNGGAQVCVLIGRTNGDDIYRDANGSPADSAVINDEVDANGAGINDPADVWVAEYMGRAKYFRVTATVTGAVTGLACAVHGQVALNVLPKHRRRRLT